MATVAQLLAIEARHPGNTHEKWQAIKDELGVSPVRYYLDLVRMLNDEQQLAEALRTDPTTTNRLLRMRDERATTRKARHVHPDH